MLAKIKATWQRVLKWCKDSETLVWARLQMILGAVVAVVMGLLADPSINEAIKSILNPDYVPYYVIVFGLLTEVLRRYRATDL